jgi:hypothetical protein
VDTIFLPLMPFLAALAFALFRALRRVECPDCGAPLPLFCSPLKKTSRMWRAGGFLCARCGCEADAAGLKVTAATPPAPFPTRQWAALAVLFVIGVGLAASVMFIGPGAAAPVVAARPAVAAPPQVAAPQRAPAAPVN